MKHSNFDEFKEKARKMMQEARFTTKGMLSDNPDILLKQLAETSAWYTALQYILSEADYWYQSYKVIALPGKIDDLTELDRKTALRSKTAERRELRELIENYSAALKDRISLGQSALGYYKELRASRIS
jgi:hypothetical protein